MSFFILNYICWNQNPSKWVKEMSMLLVQRLPRYSTLFCNLPIPVFFGGAGLGWVGLVSAERPKNILLMGIKIKKLLAHARMGLGPAGFLVF